MPQVQDLSAHVGQPPPSTHEGTHASAPVERPALTRTDRNRKFATVLGARRGEQEAGARSAEAGWPAVLAARPLAPPAEPSPARPAGAPAAVELPHRLLLAESPVRDGARLRIDGGPFAGTEIHLVAAGTRVEVCVLTPHEASRQTLAIAMEAVRNRLRARGLTMVDGSAPAEHGPRARQRALRQERSGTHSGGDGDASDR